MSPTLLILICIFFWGLWGVFTKLSNVHNSAAFVTLAGHFLYLLFSLPLIWKIREEGMGKINWGWQAMIWIILTGAVGVGAKYFYHLALSKGQASRVVPMAAAYPAVTVLIAVIFLKERLQWTQALGLVLCIAGVYLLALQKP